MIYIRGYQSDYDMWAYLGNAAGATKTCYRSSSAPRTSTRRVDYHGEGGPLRVMADYPSPSVIAAAVEAAQEAGIPLNDDHNGPELDGVGFAQLTIRDGIRDSTAPPSCGRSSARSV